MKIKHSIEHSVLCLTFSVVSLWSAGDEDPGQPHQQSHHQVDGHPRVEDLVLGPRWPGRQREER